MLEITIQLTEKEQQLIYWKYQIAKLNLQEWIKQQS